MVMGGVPVSTNDAQATALLGSENAGRQSFIAIKTLARAAGLSEEQAVIATAIAAAESSRIPNKRGDTTIQTNLWGPSYGLWQIRTIKSQTGKGTDRDIKHLQKSLGNQAAAMYKISMGGTDWTPWSVYTSGEYKDYLAAARNAKTDGGPINDAISDALGKVSELGNIANHLRRLVAGLTDGGVWIRAALVLLGAVLFILGIIVILADVGLSSNAVKTIAKLKP